MKLVPETRSSEIVEQLNEITGRGWYVDGNTFEMRKLRREIEKVRDVNAAIGWALLGSYAAISGDIAEVERCFNASMRLEEITTTHGNYHSTLGNLGYFSKAHQYFRDSGRPETGRFSQISQYAERMGSFQTVVAYDQEAREMNIETPTIHGASVHAAAVLARAGVSDEQVVSHLDAAGEVLRRHHMFYGQEIEIKVADFDGEFTGVTCVFSVLGSPDEVFELNVALAAVEDEFCVQKHPAFDVIFLPV